MIRLVLRRSTWGWGILVGRLEGGAANGVSESELLFPGWTRGDLCESRALRLVWGPGTRVVDLALGTIDSM